MDNNTWTLFLDRDGVLNRRPQNAYVTKPEDFHWIPGSLECIPQLSGIFGKIFVVTNQQGVGKGIMRMEDLHSIHQRMRLDVESIGGRMDGVYVAPCLSGQGSFLRKPQVGMALQAKKHHPGIRFRQSVMVGDTLTDMLFGKRLGMVTVLISDDVTVARKHAHCITYRYDNLAGFAANAHRITGQ